MDVTFLLLQCSISVPSMASKNLLVTAGNMARDSQMQISFLGMHAAAAGLALAERRWFHISKARASRYEKAEPVPHGLCKYSVRCSFSRGAMAVTMVPEQLASTVTAPNGSQGCMLHICAMAGGSL